MGHYRGRKALQAKAKRTKKNLTTQLKAAQKKLAAADAAAAK